MANLAETYDVTCLQNCGYQLWGNWPLKLPHPEVVPLSILSNATRTLKAKISGSFLPMENLWT
ncbi:hypothetical protein KIN20_036646 [Parelaphostrongylus tenuis]|uniref:Uncharacterized protein n=1 Tax=Parelaphostrongylus tenuis TaxID=148309 RepID=A0AAD5RCU9_PARTN|nr:hypothetical protein KIN20_036646 [Parelaphostrongylus tenuis]